MGRRRTSTVPSKVGICTVSKSSLPSREMFDYFTETDSLPKGVANDWFEIPIRTKK